MTGGIMARDALRSEATIIGVEPEGAPSMTHALQHGKNTALSDVN
jgi:threonine dehydratase